MLKITHIALLSIINLSLLGETALATKTTSSFDTATGYKTTPSKYKNTLSQDELIAIPNVYPLLTMQYKGSDTPEVCSISDFSSPCQTGECKTQKGLCGETLSSGFFSQKKSWEMLNGHINGNQGFDGFYRVTHYPDLKYVIVEDKAGESAKLSSKTHQGSLGWELKRAKAISDKYDQFKYSEFEEALINGKVVSLFTHTYFQDNRTKKKGSNISLKEERGGRVPIYSTKTNPPLSSDRYTFSTEISLLGSPSWSSSFQNSYINGYQVGIHKPIFINEINFNTCPITDFGYCVTQDSLQIKNIKLMNETQSDLLKF